MIKKLINGKWHVWNPIAWDYSSKCTLQKDGTLTFEKQGVWVECVYINGEWI
jgi:hypothetical protein